MTSTILPFCTFYNMEDLPNFPAIADELAFAGKLARAYNQRLTFHPSHFVKVAAPSEELVVKSLKELEVHSQVRLACASSHLIWTVLGLHAAPMQAAKITWLPSKSKRFIAASTVCTFAQQPLEVCSSARHPGCARQ